MRTVLAAVLAVVFAYAGAAKLLDRAGTAEAFAALRVPAAPVLATAVPAVELCVAVALLTVPRPGGAAALVVLVAVTAQLATARARGIDADCHCFGRRRRPARPARELLRNLVLGVLAAAVVAA